MRNLEHGIRNPLYVIQNPLLPMESSSHDGGFSWNPSFQVNLFSGFTLLRIRNPKFTDWDLEFDSLHGYNNKVTE